ncbi:hypothetical protein Ssi03_08950 [Sphaerisporangium siamense]|uniref:non-specific serine/threonine protein kinase n=1 Tax=Sphaerisporangium siamense TaxID=795645 RepID=A0A7W7DFU1_9ACTN|nr:serine/threonine-protein kinase [Sphaerisporangium siamense]MBB4705709.1 serine/threonine protein kinase [Sphaerisporangium siamense]GII82905.1 hypothetical protein Ssi03_08950 [Sphaerisporangium siamense]
MNPHDSGAVREGDVLTRRYRLVEQIASGGTSAIWRAFDQSLHRTVAIKVLDGDHRAIRREARATARLLHHDAIEVYDYGETITAAGRPAAYVVMRLLDGRALSERIAEGPLPWREAATVGARVARVLEAAHRRGIVHRDVTAENVLLTPEGAKLLDFGLAAFVGEHAGPRVPGTPPYAAPERLTAGGFHPAVDVYALGVLVYQMLTGVPPRPVDEAGGGRGTPGPRHGARTGTPGMPRTGTPEVPPELTALCAACVAGNPAERPAAGHVAEVLTRALDAPPIEVRDTAIWIRRVRTAAAGSALLSASAAALLWLANALGSLA